jgi:transcriptional regulator with PAS, ATPase and Fis domain
MNRRVRPMERENLRLLERYDWPGNVRELEHVMQQLLILADGDTIGRESVEDMLRELQSERLREDREGADRGGRLEDIEADAIAAVLAEENQNKTRAALRLGINRSTLRRKLQNGVKRTDTAQ